MNKGNLVVFLLLLISGVTLATVYRWVDESGRVHYGDSPPKGSDAEPIAVPKGPSEKEVERARQRMQQKMELDEKPSEKVSPSEVPEKTTQKMERDVITPNQIACYSPISDLVPGPLAEPFSPILPTLLTKAQQSLLHILFEKTEAIWKGKIIELTCRGTYSEPRSTIQSFRAHVTIDWDARKSQLIIDTDLFRKGWGKGRLVQLFEAGDALYFYETNTRIVTDTLARDRNKVEVLSLDEEFVSFIIKLRVLTRVPYSEVRKEVPRAEVRQLKVSDRTLKLSELYYNNEKLVGSRSWILSR
jgi:hypothetical protein